MIFNSSSHLPVYKRRPWWSTTRDAIKSGFSQLFANFLAQLLRVAPLLIKAGVVPNPKKEKAPLEAPLDAEASVE